MTFAIAVSGTTFSAIPPSILVADTTSVNVRPSWTCSVAGTSASSATPRARRWIALSANQGRAEWPLRPWNVHVAFTLPRQPAWTALEVGSSTTPNPLSRRAGSRSSSGVSELSPKGSSSRGKKTKPNGAPASASSIITARPPFMSAESEAVDDVAIAPPGTVALGRHRVEMPRQEDPRRALRRGARDDAPVTRIAHRHIARSQDLRHVGAERRLVVGLGRDVDQLERPGGEAFGEHRGRVARCIRPIPIRGGEHRAHRDA